MINIQILGPHVSIIEGSIDNYRKCIFLGSLKHREQGPTHRALSVGWGVRRSGEGQGPPALVPPN